MSCGRARRRDDVGGVWPVVATFAAFAVHEAGLATGVRRIGHHRERPGRQTHGGRGPKRSNGDDPVHRAPFEGAEGRARD